VAVGILSVPMEELRTLLAATSEFQTWVGAANETEAKASIHLGGSYSVGARSVVITIAELVAKRYAMGTRDWFRWSGALQARFEAAIAAEDQDDHAAAENTFLAGLDTILRAALGLSGSDDHISLESFDLEKDPNWADADEDSEYYQAPCLARWGIA